MRPRQLSLALLLSLAATVPLLAVKMQMNGGGATPITSIYRSITVEKGQTYAAVVCYLCNVTVKGEVTEAVVTMGGDITVEGRLSDAAVAIIGDVRVQNGGSIGEGAVAVGGSVSAPPNSIAGEISPTPIPILRDLPGVPRTYVILFLLFGSLSVLSILTCWGVLGSRRVEIISASLRYRWIWAAIIGVLVVAFEVGINVLGDELGTRYHNDIDIWVLVAGLLIYCIFATPGWAAISMRFARRLRITKRPLPGALIGSLVLVLLMLAPYVGVILAVAISAYSAGTTIINRFGWPPRASSTAA